MASEKKAEVVEPDDYFQTVRWANGVLDDFMEQVDDGETIDISHPATRERLDELAAIAAENTTRGVVLKLCFEHRIEGCKQMKMAWDSRRSALDKNFEGFKKRVADIVAERVKGQKTKTIKGAYGSIGVSTKDKLVTAYGEVKSDNKKLHFPSVQKAEEKGFPREFLKPKVTYVLNKDKIQAAIDAGKKFEWVTQKAVNSPRFALDSNIEVLIQPKQPKQIEAGK